jgi:hypothetical protein
MMFVAYPHVLLSYQENFFEVTVCFFFQNELPYVLCLIFFYDANKGVSGLLGLKWSGRTYHVPMDNTRSGLISRGVQEVE